MIVSMSRNIRPNDVTRRFTWRTVVKVPDATRDNRPVSLALSRALTLQSVWSVLRAERKYRQQLTEFPKFPSHPSVFVPLVLVGLST